MGTIPLFAWTKEACEAVHSHGRRYRGLHPLSQADATLLEAVNRGEFTLNGFRNHDLRRHLYAKPAVSKKGELARAASVRRRIILLRAHGLVKKLGKTHRYLVTDKGRVTITALLTARRADVAQLTKIAA